MSLCNHCLPKSKNEYSQVTQSHEEMLTLLVGAWLGRQQRGCGPSRWMTPRLHLERGLHQHL